MIDKFTLEECKRDPKVLRAKIKSLAYAIEQSQKMIDESLMSAKSLTFLKRKVADSQQDLEILYLLK
ncbi:MULTISPECIES: hypothetical protein [Prochlorococcus]|uniref:hypothetical protein n=1 Tax=Prochlorococcus TaxID=1218 RepID=UPI000533738B|nr:MULTISPECIES: hypothetical protein [Prochlorococcus]KGG12542.1 hypothetical protein EV05_1754 [Prochlorococcus sp. MIT 0601]